MGTECYDLVRGSIIRVTALDSLGRFGSPVYFATSKAVARIGVTEVVETASNEILETPEEEKRIRFLRPTQTIRHKVDINLLKVDPGALAIMTGVPLAYGYDAESTIKGFDSGSRVPVTSFALEIWSKLVGQRCADGSPKWGYTLFPHLRGGRVSGFAFTNGRASFNVIGAQTRRLPRWGVGPHDVDGDFSRMLTPVSKNTSYRQFVSPGQPPLDVVGVQQTLDVVDNGTAANPMPIPSAPLVLNGGGAITSPYIINGGRA